jgi:hypothetical protein
VPVVLPGCWVTDLAVVQRATFVSCLAALDLERTSDAGPMSDLYSASHKQPAPSIIDHPERLLRSR